MTISGKKIKTAVLALIGIGVDKVVCDTIESIVPAPKRPLAKIFTKIGTFVLGLYAAAKITEGIDKDISAVEEAVNESLDEIRAKLKEAEEDSEEEAQEA